MTTPIEERARRYLDILAPHQRIREGGQVLQELLDAYCTARIEIDATHAAVEYEQKTRVVVDCARNLIDNLDQEGACDALALLEKALQDLDA